MVNYMMIKKLAIALLIFGISNPVFCAKKLSKSEYENFCNSLYNDMYVEFSKSDDCNGIPEEVSGMATARTYNEIELYYKNKFNLEGFQSLSKSSCKTRNIINYSAFKKIVCK
jgi:hypothetical protein